MRLIYTTRDADKGRTLASFLSSEGIENQLEMIKDTDWGQPDYGVTVFKIWVIDEDTAEAAEKWAQAFDQDPNNPLYQRSGFKTTVIPTVLTSDNQESETERPTIADFMKEKNRRDPDQKPGISTTITNGLIMLCCIFYLINSLTSPVVTSFPANLPVIPFISSPIKKQFLYDYPQTYQLTDKLIKLYGTEKLQTPQALPPEGQYLVREAQNTPYWEGFYNHILAYFQNAPPPKFDAPLFEKIRQGEVWRLFTPSLMHSDFLHILFNMLWLLVLGRQFEERLSPRRYMLFILITGIFSNTFQYLMSGPNFLGFSGVICAMVSFIWVRQKVAPWEGYPLEKSTILFIIYFITALLGIQIVSFFLEISSNQELSLAVGIANTAHLSGALIGALLGLTQFFKKSNSIMRPTK